jgi:excisionase family DNA binding protein
MNQLVPQRMAYKLGEACVLLGISRPTLNADIASGRIPTITIGKRRFVSRTALDRLLTVDTGQEAKQNDK